MTPGNDPRVAFYQDGVYIGRSEAQGAAFFDVDRIEVLKGPQGTLYGRNATAGAINVISRAPTDEFSAYMNLTYGNYDSRTIEGAVSGPLADGLTVALPSIELRITVTDETSISVVTWIMTLRNPYELRLFGNPFRASSSYRYSTIIMKQTPAARCTIKARGIPTSRLPAFCLVARPWLVAAISTTISIRRST